MTELEYESDLVSDLKLNVFDEHKSKIKIEPFQSQVTIVEHIEFLISYPLLITC